MRWSMTAVLLSAIVVAPAAAAAQSRGGSVTRAKALDLFNANCQPCHGPNGQGTPAFKDLAFVGRTTWKHGSTQADVVKTITNGAPGTAMLPFKGRLMPADISALASLVRSFAQTHAKAKRSVSAPPSGGANGAARLRAAGASPVTSALGAQHEKGVSPPSGR
ncbi:MAG TPA: c-type cytochrome [Vicinamibacterales bacterium]|jgi:mono/diheme cytochrome c family protein